jgi:hypothetical protein
MASFHQHLSATTGAVTTVGGRHIPTDALRSGCPHERRRAAARLLGRLCDASARDVLASLLCRLSPILARMLSGSGSNPPDPATAKGKMPVNGESACRDRLLMETASALYFAVPAEAAKRLEQELPGVTVAELEAVAAEFAIKLPLHSVVRVGVGGALSSLDGTDHAMGEIRPMP